MTDDQKHSANESNEDNELSVKELVLRSLRENNIELDKSEEKDTSEDAERLIVQPESPVGSRRTSSRKTDETSQQELADEIDDDMPETSFSSKRKTTRKKEDRIVGRIVLVVVSALIVIGGILGFSVYSYITDSLRPLDSSDSQLVQVEVPIGSSNKSIGTILEENDIIKSGLVFNYYTKFNNYTDFQSGYYQMAPNMTLDEIAKMLEDGGTAEPVEVADAKVTIPEGFTIDQIADRIAEQTDYSKEDFLALMTDKDFFNQMLEKYPDLLTSASAEVDNMKYLLEGYLFPATYDYYKETSLQDFVSEMVGKANSVVTPYLEEISEDGLTVHKALTLASLVEKEGVKEADRQAIAQVFFNRLAVDMPLQSDISVLYALGEHKEKVYNKDTEVDSPYNLYLNTGVGPGPFNSPSEDALKAVLNPTDNDYYYFVADIDTGNVYFAATYEEHLQLVEEHVNNK